MNGAMIATPRILKIRLPSGTCRAATFERSVVITASSPLPRLAPSTRPSPTSTGIPPEPTMVAVSSTVAKLEYDTTDSTAPIVISSMRSLVSDASSVRTAGDCVSTEVASVIKRNASSIRPSPMSTRPSRPAVVSGREMYTTTPTKMNSGESHDKSSENSTAITLVPRSAPSITANAAGSAIKPCPTNDETINAVAVLDCTSAVTPTPDMTAAAGVRTLRAIICRSLAPNTRKIPVRTSWVPQTSRATAANRFRRCFMAADGFLVLQVGLYCQPVWHSEACAVCWASIYQGAIFMERKRSLKLARCSQVRDQVIAVPSVHAKARWLQHPGRRGLWVQVQRHLVSRGG